jgi:hypothetical protein
MIESDTGGGLIKKMIHGEEEKEAEKKNLSPESTKNKLFMLISFSLVVLSLSTIFFFILNDKVSTVDVLPQFVPLIFNDKTTFLSVDGFSKEKIIKTILTEVNTAKVKVGGLDGIYLISNKRLVGLRQFFSLIKSNFLPGDVNFLNDNFLLGVVNNEVERAPFLPPDEDHTGKDFFILMKMRSMPDVFDSFRAWENKMFLDLHEFFKDRDLERNSISPNERLYSRNR